MNFRIAHAAFFVTLGLHALATHAGAQEGEATEETSDETPSDSDEAPGPEKAPRPLYLLVTSGLGYAALSEDRPDSMGSSSASKVSAGGLAVQVYVGAGYRLSSVIALGGALALTVAPSPGIEYEMRGVGTPVIEDGSAIGGVIGPMAAFAISQSFELNAVLGYGGFGRSEPRPGFGGKGFAVSAAAADGPASASNIGLAIELRLSGGFFSYDSGSDGGTYSSTLLQPTLMAGIKFR